MSSKFIQKVYHEAFAGDAVNRPILPDTSEPELSSEHEQQIRAWLAYIDETDSEVIADVLAQCRMDVQALHYFLSRFRQDILSPLLVNDGREEH